MKDLIPKRSPKKDIHILLGTDTLAKLDRIALAANCSRSAVLIELVKNYEETEEEKRDA